VCTQIYKHKYTHTHINTPTQQARQRTGTSREGKQRPARSPSESSTSSSSACLSNSTSLTSTGLSTSTGPSLSPPLCVYECLSICLENACIFVSAHISSLDIARLTHVHCDTQMEGEGETAVSQRAGGVRQEPAEAPPRHPRQRKPRPKNS